MPRVRFRCDVVEAGFTPRLLLGQLEEVHKWGPRDSLGDMSQYQLQDYKEKAVVNVVGMMRFNMKLARLNDGLLLVLVKSDLARSAAPRIGVVSYLLEARPKNLRGKRLTTESR